MSTIIGGAGTNSITGGAGVGGLSDLGVVTAGGTISPIGAIGTVTISNTNGATMSLGESDEDIMERWIMNRVTIDHKVQEQELMKLKEVAPDYANEIKENLAKNAARDMIKKITFTKKHDKNADVHHFIGRVWCFTEQEMKEFIKEVRNV
jgi:hypothetical protein